MAWNPYEAPKSPIGKSGRSWRAWWRRVCLGGLIAAPLLFAAMTITQKTWPEFDDSRRRAIVIGLLAFAQLFDWTLVGLAGIGWIVSRRPRADD